MSEIKYTSDGRKVVVIGRLNNTEMIVQEVFVRDDGSEIPSGEQFTAKGLHDAPVKSWQEKHSEKMTARYDELQQQVTRYAKDVAKAQQEARVVARALRTFSENAMDEHLATLEDCFESLLHKYNWIRRYFATMRYENHGAVLMYQPRRLRGACRSYPIDRLIAAVDESLSQRRDNYFVAFLEILGEVPSYGGWDMYDYADKI